MINILNFYMQYGLVSLLQCTVLPMQAKICINKIKITKNTSFMKEDYVLQLVTCNLLMCSTFWENLNDIRKAESEKSPTISIHVIITSIPFPITICVPLVIIQNITAVVTSISKDILVTVSLVNVGNQDTVILQETRNQPSFRP